MTIKMILAAAALSGGAALNAATLNVATAVQSRPDASSPVISVLPAGSQQPAVSDKAASGPAGWIAVELSGPFQGYVKNKDLTKQLDILPGSSIYLSPKDEGSAFATYEKGDKADITGLHGKWTQITLQKTLVGYIQGSAVAATAPMAPETAAAPAPSAPVASAAPLPQPPTDDAGLSKLFEGTLTGTRTLLMPKRPYDWQLVDSDGKRVAYLDLSKLLLTDQIDSYTGHSVVVLGFLESVKKSDDLVIHAEGLRLK
ncbi:MAG TPA: hypothetical protein VFE25_07345 [Opitutaceae bacterium]|jgi:hypothetical protein|nr:hypothetical protein [Opitutaceae bacterium]